MRAHFSCTCAAFALALLAACSKSEKSSAQPAPSNAIPTVGVPSPSPVASTAQPSASAPLPSSAQAVVEAWTGALNAHDTDTLKRLYAKEVDFYGHHMSIDRVIAQKTQALKQAPDYRQWVENISTEQLGSDQYRVTFDKSWEISGKKSTVRALLQVHKTVRSYVITLESDAKAQAQTNAASCLDAVMALVISTKEATVLLNGPTDPDGGHTTNGLHFGSIPPESKDYAVAVHESHEDHLATLGWFEVDPKTGKVTHDEQPISADAQKAAKVRQLCSQ